MLSNNNNHYKIILSDIDGTLLNKERELSTITIDEVKRVTKNNLVKFILVSARMPSGIIYLQKQLNISTPIICYNGALIISPSQHNGYKVLESHSMDYEIVSWLIAKSKELELHCSIYSDDTWVTEKKDSWSLREENNTKTFATISDLNITLKNWKDSNHHIHKVMIMGDSNLIDRIENQGNEEYSNLVNIYRSKDTYLEISPKSTSKAIACSYILNQFNVSRSEAVAFGDNFNDIEMISMVKLGVAMGNAIEEVKNVAKIIAPPNSFDGVAVTLKELFI